MKISSRTMGFACAALAAVTYGMNPFFGIPLYGEGLTPLSVLFYRFSFAALLMGIWGILCRKSFVLPRRYWAHTFCGGILLGLTCLFWFLTFRIMDSGISATILFIYPVMVAGIMFLLYKEKISRKTLLGTVIALTGVVVLCQPGSGSKVHPAGLVYILLSALSYAIYIVAVKKSRLRELQPELLTFYALLFAIPVFLVPLRLGVDLQGIPSWKALFNALGLGLFPSLLSFLLTAVAVKHIGPTQTSVLGALEPVTAVLIGAFFFHEAMSVQTCAGIVMILAAVTVIIWRKNEMPEPAADR